MLTAIASSMITVAGTVFSVTIVALSLAATQYSPRVLRTFTSDHPTQMVLGAFVGIFVYCLIVLRTIRGGDDPDFVPPLAVLGGLLLALVGIALLVYFIHHLAESIQASAIVSRIASATLDTIDRLFPEDLGRPDEAAARAPAWSGAWTPISAAETGYIIRVDTDGLLRFARKLDRTIRMESAIGDFVIAGQALASVEGVQPLDAKLARKLNRHYSIDVQRTVEQDPGYGIQQIVDIACKALSPAMNDSSTAVLCIDRLTEILVRLARRRMPSPYRSAGANSYVVARGPEFADLVELAYQRLFSDGRDHELVLLHLLASIERVGSATDDRGRLTVLCETLARATPPIPEAAVQPAGRRTVVARATGIRAHLLAPRFDRDE
jgi:uncharacterized membrane protein